MSTNWSKMRAAVGANPRSRHLCSINVAALGLGLVSVRQAVRYRRGDSRLPRVGVLQALSAAGLLLTALFQLALDHH